MGDGFGIEGARRRDWIVDDDPHPVGAGAPADHAGGAGNTLREDAEDDTITAWGARSDHDRCDVFNYRTHDFDRCVFDVSPGGLASRVMPEGLFIQEDADTERIAPTDVHQGQMGDCHLTAPLAALASTADGRALIHDAITERRNEKGDVVAYSVKLYERDVFGRLVPPKKPIEVPAGGPYVVGHARAVTDGRVYEVWPLVIEKAYAELRHGYNAIGKGGEVLSAMEALTGRPIVRLPPASASQGVWGDPHSAVVLSSKRGLGSNAYGVMSEHAYAVTRCLGGPPPLVELYDPVGDRQLRPIPVGELATLFAWVDVTRMGGTP